MHEAGRSGKLCGTVEQLAQSARCPAAVLSHALTDLQSTGTANVTERNGIVTVANRRMVREHKEREGTRLRVTKFRCNGSVTPEKSDVISQRSDPERLNDAKSNGAQRPCLPGNRSSLTRLKEKALMGSLRQFLGEEEMATCGGHWRKDHVRKHPWLLERALNELESKSKEGTVYDNRAAALEDLIKRWV